MRDKKLHLWVWVPDDVVFDDSAIEAIESAAANEAYEQVQVMRALSD